MFMRFLGDAVGHQRQEVLSAVPRTELAVVDDEPEYADDSVQEPAEILPPPDDDSMPTDNALNDTAGDDDNEEALLPRPPARRVPQMRTAKARDGGRTQSGGVRGVPADDLDDL